MLAVVFMGGRLALPPRPGSGVEPDPQPAV